MLVSVTDNQITFQLKGTTLLSRLVGGSFPNYEQVIPTKREVIFSAPTKDLLAVTKRASLCAVDRGGSVKFALKKGVLNVTSSSQNNEFTEELAVEYSGTDFAIAFNPQFVVDALKHVDTDKTVVALPNGTAQFSAGVLLLAAHGGVPVIPATMVRRKDGAYHAQVFAPMFIEERGSRAETLAFYSQRIADKFVPVLAAYPDQWYQFVPLSP